MELNDLVKVMVGKELADRFPKLKVKLGKEVLRLENMSYYGRIRNINLDVKRGGNYRINGAKRIRKTDTSESAVRY